MKNQEMCRCKISVYKNTRKQSKYEQTANMLSSLLMHFVDPLNNAIKKRVARFKHG